MSENDDETVHQLKGKGGGNKAPTPADILNSLASERVKSLAEAAKAKVRDRQKVRDEHQRAINQIDEEIKEILEEYTESSSAK